jgi:acyl-CoA thioester hydrolase
MKNIQALAAYLHIHEREVVWGDMDAMQHVNNTKYFYYCETARLEFLSVALPALGLDMPHDAQTGIALAETACRFKVSLTYPDELLIGTAVSQIGETEFSIKQAIFSKKLDLVAAEATARMVYYDFVKRQRIAIDEKTLAILEHYSL